MMSRAGMSLGRRAVTFMIPASYPRRQAFVTGAISHGLGAGIPLLADPSERSGAEAGGIELAKAALGASAVHDFVMVRALTVRIGLVLMSITASDRADDR